MRSLARLRPLARPPCPVHGRGVHMLRDMPTPTVRELDRKPRLQTVTWGSTPDWSTSPSHRMSEWTRPPRRLLLIQKPDDARTTKAMGDVLRHVTTRYPHLQLLVEPHTAKDHPEFDQLVIVEQDDLSLLPLFTDLVITVGGDGTVLHVSTLFSQGECPPVLCFSMGSLGFLLPFHIRSLVPTLETTLLGPVPILNRNRLACMPVDREGLVLDRCAPANAAAGWQVMNEVTLHRGRHPHLTVVDAFYNGQHLTEAVADGLLVSTPTGSTAYSLSSGGPICHPEADSVLLTPIAPRSLSFRSVILPGQGVVRLEISPRARCPAELSIDGREVCNLEAHESVIIRKSPFPVPCVERAGNGTGWVKDINNLLLFNSGFINKSLQDHY